MKVSDYEQGQIDLIDSIASDVLDMLEKEGSDVDMMLDVLILLKKLKPIEKNDKV